jgi:DNA-binding NarL/FixJ family response regulator
VLQLLASGLTNKQIATRLHVSPKTVMHHALAIYRVLGVRSRSEATAWAFRTGLTQ